MSSIFIVENIPKKIIEWLKITYKSYKIKINSNNSIGVLAITKNESRNIKEWIDHYRWQGLDKIFLIDNGSTDDTYDLIRDDIASGFIQYFYRPQRHRQSAHYRDIFKKARIRQKVDWLIVADLDEFWYSPSGNLKLAINDISSDVDLIYANWRLFGSSGQVEHPESVRKSFVFRHPYLGRHCNTKWICRTCCIRSSFALGIHKVKGIDSHRVVSDNERFHLNHYIIQSVQYFEEVKMTRGAADKKKFETFRDMDYFNQIDSEATLEDRTLSEMLR